LTRAVRRLWNLFPAGASSWRPGRTDGNDQFCMGTGKGFIRLLAHWLGGVPEIFGAMVRVHDLSDDAQFCQAGPIRTGAVGDDRDLFAGLSSHAAKLLGGNDVLPG